MTRTPGTGGDVPALPAAVLRTLAATGTAIADRFGRPQDIEWAVADGTVWVVQARPMTALPPPPVHLNRVQRFIGQTLIELVPMRPYPLDMTAWTVPGWGRILSRMLDDMLGLRVDVGAMLPEVEGVVDRFVPPLPRPTLRTLASPARLLVRALRHDPATWTDDPRFALFERRSAELAAPAVATMTWHELTLLPRQALDALDLITALRVDHLPRVGASLALLRVTVACLGLTGTFGTLILGGRTRTQDANRALARVAYLVRSDDVARATVARLDPEALADRVRSDPALAPMRAALDEVLVAYGHRETSSPMLLSPPTWADAPATVLGIVKALATDPGTTAAIAPGTTARPGAARAGEPATVTTTAGEPATATTFATAAGDQQARAMERLLAHPAVRWTRSGDRLRRLVAAARTGVAFREDTHFHGTRVLPVVRHAVLEMGRRLAAAGVLDAPDDIWHLYLEEVERLPAPTAVPRADADRLRATARRRMARREELTGVPLIGAAVLYPSTALGAGEALVAGVAASGGRATGPVRVVRGPEQFGLLRGGDVLVCPSTNPSWTPLFQRAAAVVVDGGGAGSHAAIVAREHGIPAVMGTGSATTALTDGQVVTVDGDAGRVFDAGPAQPHGTGTTDPTAHARG